MSRHVILLVPSRALFSRRHPLAAALCMSLLSSATAVSAEKYASDIDTVYVTAQQIARQALGTSTITAEDIARRPPANDIAELLRTMPGVNLTGNSASGQYGNNRQIDLRGMGPENTLILVDGKRIGARDAVRMGRSGERNTRGDTNWVPAEMIERIEVLRGPAAARYGSGASGGVVNIITKRPTGELSGALDLYGLMPEHRAEGGSERVGVQLRGPMSEALSFRLYGNLNRTDADSLDLNRDFARTAKAVPPAGREGVKNRDLNALLRWDVTASQVLEFETGISRQGNIYAGDRAVSNTGTSTPIDLAALAVDGAETNRMYRNTGAITHRGRWGDISSRITAAVEGVNNSRINEGLAGGPEGSFNSANWSTSRLRNYQLDGELSFPATIGGAENVWTLGFEYLDSRLADPYSMSQSSSSGGGLPGLSADRMRGKSDAKTTGVYVEDNIYLGERWILTPGLRFDHQSQFGNNASPSLNAQFRISSDLVVKGGIARAFKAPNLYQSNPDYLYYTRGKGCPNAYPSSNAGGGGCYVRGNDRLDPETSINKEIGVEWAPENGWHSSLTYFHNDYKDKVQAGYVPIGRTRGGRGQAWIFKWENAPKAVVRGLEGNLNVPLLGERGETLKWSTNFTYMAENKNKSTGQPLSIIPEYTVNTTLDWRSTEKLSLLLIGTFYGKQEPARNNINNDPKCGPGSAVTCAGALVLQPRDPYNLWSLSARYRVTSKVSLGVGINNIGDKRMFREANSNEAGAATYNEPGRAYWASMSVGF